MLDTGRLKRTQDQRPGAPRVAHEKTTSQFLTLIDR
jgi:hypothetical protein